VDAEGVLRFWFGELDAQGCADEAHRQRWFRAEAAFDEEIRRQFGRSHEEVMNGEHEAWCATPRGRLAPIIVLDQFSRNLYREQARCLQGDERALATALESIDAGLDESFPCDERRFLYMPLMHSEDLSIQARCVRLFAGWLAEASGPIHQRVAESLDFAKRHRDVIARFGRFPQRNVMLNRTSTAEELEFLQRTRSAS
jgi:uncharacterized protein (DUF924 family)